MSKKSQLPVKLEETVSSVLKDITTEMKNSFCNILKELFSLTLEMPGRLNYTQPERMGIHTGKTYREAFSKQVDWAGVQKEGQRKGRSLRSGHDRIPGIPAQRQQWKSSLRQLPTAGHCLETSWLRYIIPNMVLPRYISPPTSP
ncbi:MAG: hypothetical protein HDR88_02795 [Bacteroides sp.]|nr:hypothetical protein [Bacteroides sp.]